MGNNSLNTPPFPRLVWDQYFWTGEVRLPSWAGFQSRRGGYGAVDRGTPADGTARLFVAPVDVGGRSPPTPKQAAAFLHLLNNEPAVAAAVGRALVDYYHEEGQDAYLDGFDEGEVDPLPDASGPNDLRPFVGLSIVHVLSVVRDGIAYVGFEFGCVWDDEHGVGVLTHRGRVVAVGGAATAFDAGAARRDGGV